MAVSTAAVVLASPVAAATLEFSGKVSIWCSIDGTKQATVKGKLDGDKCYAESLTVEP